MYATLENRQSHSALALNALRVNQAIVEKGNARLWAALFILSSAVSAVDYLAGTAWRLPVSIISLPALISKRETDLPTFKELLLCAARTFYCAIGILIFPIIGIFNPEKALKLLEDLHLVAFPKKKVTQPKVPVPSAVQESKPQNYIEITLPSKSNAPDVLPSEYKDKELVRLSGDHWEKIIKLKNAHTKITRLLEAGKKQTLEVKLFPSRWDTKIDTQFPTVLEFGKVDKMPLWKIIANTMKISSAGRPNNDVIKEIVKTLYRVSRKPTAFEPKNIEPVKALEETTKVESKLISSIHHEDAKSLVDLNKWNALPDIIPPDYKNKTLVTRLNAEWVKVTAITFRDLNLKIASQVDANGILSQRLFQDRWRSDSMVIPYLLQTAMYGDVPLWKYVAQLINISIVGKKEVDVMKSIISTLYRVSEKNEKVVFAEPDEEKLDAPVVQPRIANKYVFESLKDIKQSDVRPIDANNPVGLKWEGEVFQGKYINNELEIDLYNYLKSTWHIASDLPLWKYVAKRLGIDSSVKVRGAANKELFMIEKIIRKVYPGAKNVSE
jgi:hypothetical protein